MTDVGTALINAYRNNIHRYNRLLQTHLTDIERQYIQARLLDHQSAIRALLGREIEHSPRQDSDWRDNCRNNAGGLSRLRAPNSSDQCSSPD